MCEASSCLWQADIENGDCQHMKLVIGQNWIGNEIFKQRKFVAYYVNYGGQKKNFVNKNGKLRGLEL